MPRFEKFESLKTKIILKDIKGVETFYIDKIAESFSSLALNKQKAFENILKFKDVETFLFSMLKPFLKDMKDMKGLKPFEIYERYEIYERFERFEALSEGI